MRASHVATIVMLMVMSAPCWSSDVIVSSQNRHGVLGSAYSTDTQSLLGAECVKGRNATVGVDSSTFSLEQKVEQSELEKELGLEIGGKARFGAYEASAAASFMNRSAESAYSIGLIYKSEILFAPQKLLSDEAQYTTTAKPIVDKKQYSSWPKVCGDSFISERTQGGRLFFSIKIDFRSSQQQQAFTQSFNLSGPLVSVNQKLDIASKSFQKDVKVTVSGFQIGGDPTKLTGLFGTAEDAANSYAKCTFGDFEACSTVIANAIKYATNTGSGFPSQVAQGASPGPVDISYVVTPYDAYNMALVAPPGVNQLIQVSRDELSRTFEHSFWEFRQVNGLIDLATEPHRKKDLAEIKQAVLFNLGVEHRASDVCFDTPASCRDVLEKLDLKPIDDDQLLPDTFRTSCIEGLKLTEDDPLRVTVNVLVSSLSPKFTIVDATDCAVYERLLTKQTYLSLPGKHLSNLIPLQSFVNLRRLILDDNEIEDTRPLSGLRNLTLLYLDKNKIRTLDPLSSLDQLESLSVSGNQVKSLEPLEHLYLMHDVTAWGNLLPNLKGIGGLDRLRFLDVSGNNLRDLSDISNGVKRLGCISIGNNLLDETSVASLRNEHPGVIVVKEDGYASARGPIDFLCEDGTKK